MSSIGSGYDLSASQFSPDGKVFQVEYAQKAVENSGTIVALRGSDGVVLAVEKFIQSKLHETEVQSMTRVFHIEEGIGASVAGLLTDCLMLVEYARDEAADYRESNGVRVPLKVLANRVADYVHAHTLYSAVRPFGVNIILAAVEADVGPQIYMVEPSGVVYGYSGVAAGKAKQTAHTEIEKLALSRTPCEELVKEAARIIHVCHDETKDKAFELEMSWVREGMGYERVARDTLMKADSYGKKALDDTDSDSD